MLKLLNIPDNAKIIDYLGTFEKIFDDVLDRIVETYGQKNTRMVLLLESDDLTTPVCLPLSHLNTYSGEYIVNSIAAVLQSRSNLKYSSSFRIRCGVVHYSKYQIGGRVPLIDLNSKNNYFSLKKKNRSVFFTPVEEDGQCLLRSIAYALKFRQMGAKWVRSVSRSPEILEKEAKKLAINHNLEWGKKYMFHDVQDLEYKLSTMITLISVYRSKHSYVYLGNNQFKNKRIFLFLTPPVQNIGDSNYDQCTVHCCVIKDLSRFLGNSKTTCDLCYKIINKKGRHLCVNDQKSNFCYNCESIKCTDFNNDPYISCKRCQRTFGSENCFMYHIDETSLLKNNQRKKSTCSKKFICHYCLTSQTDIGGNSPEKHVHFTHYCKNCHFYVDNGHKCHMKIGSITEGLTKKIIVLDFECVISDPSSCESPNFTGAKRADGSLTCITCNHAICGTFEHTPIFAGLNITCDMCVDVPFKQKEIDYCNYCGIRCGICNKTNKENKYINEPCKDYIDEDQNPCGARTITFQGHKCVEKVIDFLNCSKHKNYTIFAMNSGAYDNFFFYQSMEVPIHNFIHLVY